jgi:ribosomal protein S10
MIHCSVTLKSFEKERVEQARAEIEALLTLLPGRVTSVCFPKQRKLMTLLRSPHIDKKSREQFEQISQTLKLFFSFQNPPATLLFVTLLKDGEFPGVELTLSLSTTSEFV